MMDRGELEGVARAVLERYGFERGPVDAFDLAGELRIHIEYYAGAAGVRAGRRCVYLPAEHRPTRLHSILAHEIAHILLDDFGIAQCEACARYLGAALLAPRDAIDRQLRGGWHLHRLMGHHLNASGELLGRRVTEVRPAMAGFALYERGRFRYGIGPRLAPARERELVAHAFDTREPARVDDLTGAWPFGDHDWPRVVVLSSAA